MAETLTDIMKGFISEEQAMREEAPDQPTTASLVKAGAIELGDYEKGFFENQADAVKGALAQARTIAPSIWQHIGQSAQEYKRKYDFLSKKTLKGGEWDPDGKNVISDTMMIIGGMLEFTDMWPTELQEEYAEYMAENPWDMEIKDSVTNKIFNTPVESIRKEIKDHYWLHPDERPDQADSFMDGLLNPSKGVASVIQSLPMAVGSMSALYFKQPTLAAAIIFGAEGSDAYEDSLAYLMDNDVAEGKMSEAEAKNEARKMYVAYGAAATAIEMWQMDKWLKLGKNLGTAAHNLLAGEFIRKGLKHKNKSFTGDWIKNAIFQTLEENTQGTLQEAIAHNNFDRPIEGGIRGFMQRRGAEAITMLYMGAPGLPGSVSFDIMNGPVQRSDGYVKRDVAAIAEAREHERKAGRKFMNPEDYMVPTILSRRHDAIEKLVNTVFGKKVVWYSPKNEKANRYDGANHPTRKDTIILNTDGKRTLSNVALHEVVHSIRRNSEQEYQQLVDTVMTFVRTPEMFGAELAGMIKDLRKHDVAEGQEVQIDPAEVSEEMVAEIIGRLAQESAFMDRLANRTPGTVAQMGRKLNKLYLATMKKIQKRKTRRVDAENRFWVDPYIENMEGLINQTLEVLQKRAATEDIDVAEAEVQEIIAEEARMGEAPTEAMDETTEAMDEAAVPDLGEAGKAITENMYQSFLDNLKKNGLAEPFSKKKQSKVAKALNAAWKRNEIKTIDDVKRIAQQADKKKALKKAAERKAEDVTPPKQELAKRPDYEIVPKTSADLRVDLTEAVKDPDMTPQEEQRLLHLIDQREQMEAGRVADVGLTAEQVSFEIDKYRPKAMKERVWAARRAVEDEGAGVVDPAKIKTKAGRQAEQKRVQNLKMLANRKKRFSIAQWFEAVKSQLRIERATESTIYARISLMKKLNDYMKSHNITDLNDLSPDHVRDWVRGMSRGGAAASSINLYLRTLRAMFNRFIESGELGTNPFGKEYVVEAKETKKKPRLVNRKAVDAAIKAIPKKDKRGNPIKTYLRDVALIQLLFSSGIRASEATGMEEGDISLAAGRGEVFGKGQKWRGIFFTKGAAKAIDKYVKNERNKIKGHELTPSLFLSRDGNTLSRSAIRKIVQKHFDRVGIKLTTHELRHSFAVDLLEHGVSVLAIQKLLGHANLETTAIYLDMSIEHLKKAIKHLPDPQTHVEGKTVIYHQPMGEVIEGEVTEVYTPKHGDTRPGGGVKYAARKLTAEERKRARLEYSLGVLREQKMQAALKKKREYIVDYMFANFPTLEKLVSREGMMKMKGDVLMKLLHDFSKNIKDLGREGEAFTINRLRSEWLDLFYEYDALQTSMVKLEKGYPVRDTKERPMFAARKLTAEEKKLGITQSLPKNMWTTMLGLTNMPGMYKSWILGNGDVAPVMKLGDPLHPVWAHMQQAIMSGANVSKLFKDGLVKHNVFQRKGNEPISHNFEMVEQGVNSANLATMKQIMKQFTVEGRINVLTVTVGDRSGRIEYSSADQIPMALDQAITMARTPSKLSPAINREAAKAWNKHIEKRNAAYERERRKEDEAKDKDYRALIKRLKNEEKKAAAAYKRGLIDAKRELVRMVASGIEWRKEFANYVQENLPPHVRGKLLKTIAGITSKETNLKAMGKVLKEIERLEKAEAKGRLKKWLARFGKKYGYRQKQGYKKGMKFKIATPFSAAIESILDNMMLVKPRDPASLQEMLEYVLQEKAMAEEELKAQGREDEVSTHPFIRHEIDKSIETFERKLKSQKVADMTADEINQLLELLDTILGEHEYKRSQRAKDVQERRAIIKEASLEEVGSGHKKVIPEASTDKDFGKGRSRYRTKHFWLGLFGRFNYNISTLVKIMGGMSDGALYHTLVRQLQRGRDDEKSHVFMMMDEFQRLTKKAGITKKDLMRWSHYGNIRPSVFSRKIEAWLEKNVPGALEGKVEHVETQDFAIQLESGETLRLTVAEGLSLLMHVRNEFAYNQLKKNGIVTRRDPLKRLELKDDDFDTVRAVMPPKALQLLDIMADLMDMQSDAINEVSLELYGYNLANVENYWHIRRYRMKGVAGKQGEKLQPGPIKQTIESRSHLKERKGGTDPIYIDDAFNELVDATRVAAEYIGLAKPLEDIRWLTNDQDVVKALLERGYGDYYRDYVMQVDSIQEHPIGLDWWEKLYGSWVRNITRAVFGLNLRVSAQQYASVMLALTEFGMGGLKSVRGRFSKEETDRAGRWSPMLRERFMGAITRELGDVAQTGGVMRFMTGSDQMVNIPTFLVRLFDKMAVMDVWRMAEDEVANREQYAKFDKAQLIKEADTLSLAERKALDKKRGSNTARFKNDVTERAEEVVRTTQPTWDIVDRSRIGSVKNPVIKGFTMFHSQREKMAQMIGIANSKYMNQLEWIRREHGLENLREAAKTEAGIRAFKDAARTYALVLTNTALVKAWGIMYGVGMLGREDDEKDWATAVLADIPGMYYFGDLGRGPVISWSKKMRGKKTYQLGAYEAPPQRVVSASKSAVYEMGNLILMSTGMMRASDRDVEKQMYKVLDTTWEAAQYAFGGPFLHATQVSKTQYKRLTD